jgi:hypothetical protein
MDGAFILARVDVPPDVLRRFVHLAQLGLLE